MFNSGPWALVWGFRLKEIHSLIENDFFLDLIEMHDENLDDKDTLCFGVITLKQPQTTDTRLSFVLRSHVLK